MLYKALIALLYPTDKMLYPSAKFIRGPEVVYVHYPVGKMRSNGKFHCFYSKFLDRKWRFVNFTGCFTRFVKYTCRQGKLSTRKLIPIRFVLEYGFEAFHFTLTEYLCADLERVQKRVTSIIFPGFTYDERLGRSGLVFLRDRRQDACRKLFNEATNDPHHKLSPLLPATRNSVFCKPCLPKVTLRQRNYRTYYRCSWK